MESFRNIFQWYKKMLLSSVEEDSICLYGKANTKIILLHIPGNCTYTAGWRPPLKVTFSSAVWFPDAITQEIQQVCLSRRTVPWRMDAKR